MKKTKQLFKQLREDAYDITCDMEKPPKVKATTSFFSDAKYAISLIFKEKEIIFFAMMQLISIMAGYFLWVSILDIIPEEVWKSAEDTRGDGSASPADIVLLAWSFVCVGLVVYPLGLFSACMGAAHFLHKLGFKSTVGKCIKIVSARAWPIWVFSWIDGWWTIGRIVERLPKKNDNVSFGEKLRNEALYQAWKVASLGIIPALIIGRTPIEACKDSLGMLKTKFLPLIKLRIGYSVFCWFFGIASYVLMFFFYPTVRQYMDGQYDIYIFYVCAGGPIFFALFFIQLIFRPIYIISACNIYSSYVKENAINVVLKPAKFSSSIIVYMILVIGMIYAYSYRDELGITKMLSTPYTQQQTQ